MEKVTAAITTYKRDLKTLKRAFESAHAQTYTNMEFVVVDDSPESFTGRKEIALYFNSLNSSREVIYIQHKANMGGCAARNTAIRNATGKMIAFLDDDDEWESTKIEKQVSKMEETGADLIYLSAYTIKDEKTGETKLKKNALHSGNVFDFLMAENFIGSTSFPLIKTDVLRELEGFDTGLRASQDYDMWLRIAQKHQIDYVVDPLAVYYVHSGESITNNVSNKIQGIQCLISKYQDYMDKHPATYSKRLIALVPNYIKGGDKESARKMLLKAIRIYPLNFKDNLKWSIYYFTHK